MDLKRKEFTPKKEDKHNQSSKKRVPNSKSRSLINLIYLLLKNSEFFIYKSLLMVLEVSIYSFGKCTVIYK